MPNLNDQTRHTCINTQLKDQLQQAKRRGLLRTPAVKRKRRTKTYQTLGQALKGRSKSCTKS